jgi:DNA invertase Pin-like site-specific DNA recombinase
MKVGYCRVSSDDQSLDVQRQQLTEAGCERIFEEKVSGESTDNRGQLQAALQFVREGDVLLVAKLDRLARSTVDMLTIITDLGKRGVKFTSLAEPWADTTSAAGELMLTVMAGVAQFERKRIKERQREGIDAAKQKGVYRGRKPTVPVDRVRELRAQGVGPAQIARELGISESSVFRALGRETA